MFLGIKKDKRVLFVLLFKSTSNDEHHSKSDIDIALITPGLSHFYYSVKK
ncbi:MAG: hypothetical protein KGY67_04315 [Candidatus Thermoplasmatota archaeon]|nr:hypothetical protein [Candidatus Thermoplasmatota archaeon]